jgi:RNA polymerase sigma factor (sigma-70 family)
VNQNQAAVAPDNQLGAPLNPARLFETHAQALFAYATRRLDSALAEDIVAETFRSAIEGAGRFDPALGNERAWLFGIASNLIRRHWRTEQRRLAALVRSHGYPIGYTDDFEGIDGKVDTQDRMQRLIDRVGQLAPDDRDLLVLIAWEGFSNREAAAVLGIPAGTVGSRLHRIRAALRQGETHDD